MELCIALDMPSAAKNLDLAEKLADHDLWMKVGLRSYIRDGRAFVETLRSINPHFRIFLDLKLYDIPNTMADAAEVIADMDIEMFNIHASAGSEAMEAVMERLSSRAERPTVLAVTALTSFGESSFRDIYGESIDKKASEFARVAYESGLDGVVCSVFESDGIKRATSQKFLTLCPGIRPYSEGADDQRRVADLRSAYQEKADFAVVGRPVYNDPDPKAKVERILEDMRSIEEREKPKGRENA